MSATSQYLWPSGQDTHHKSPFDAEHRDLVTAPVGCSLAQHNGERYAAKLCRRSARARSVLVRGVRRPCPPSLHKENAAVNPPSAPGAVLKPCLYLVYTNPSYLIQSRRRVNLVEANEPGNQGSAENPSILSTALQSMACARSESSPCLPAQRKVVYLSGRCRETRSTPQSSTSTP